MLRINIFSALLFGIMAITACNKETESDKSTNNCANVVFPDGPAFVKVINDYPETIKVQLIVGNIAGYLSSEIESGHCEIFGVPVYNSEVEVRTLDNSKSRIVQTSTQAGQTITIHVRANFF